MPSVAALYRYPAKGFTPEPRDDLLIEPDGRVQGDRVLAFRFATAATPQQRDGLDYWPKDEGLALMQFPSLARLRLQYDSGTRRVRIRDGERVLADADLSADGRRVLEDAVTAFLAGSPDAARIARDGILPLRLVGDGVTSRFQDRPRGYVSLHGTASVAAVDGAVEAPVDDRRFRSNIVVSGTAPWEELAWTGRIRIGEVAFEVQNPIGRCAAILANPDTGERDARLLRTLTAHFDQAAPTFGVLLLPADGPGRIRVGDTVSVG
ncbi:MOSC domain-containing protein [Microbacterium sp. RD1]|uniref:MOSC domain-containing protein n=1 Tax=Microbacterium sp. RD1 TaxID=3457313 RepID=UPI003FA57A4A